MKHEILGVIPARGGSKGIPHKNIRDMQGKPLIAHTIEKAKQSRYIDRLIVSTDDPKIADVARFYGAEVPFLRPAELASDSSRAIDAIKHALITMEDLDHKRYEYIVYLEPTSPNRSAEDIDDAVDLFLHSDADSLASVVEATQYHPILMKTIENGYLKPIYKDEPEGMPRQEYAPKAYMRNGAVYIFRRENVLQRILWGQTILPYVMPIERSACIDDMNDWYLAEIWMQKLNQR
ncbi:cytidylyltransferase domain-containing protein [uncultured Parabacteroides sp.]|uniref:acylneuraminate cytidylyltransferase family protein n=1 Tax=uncultured Parabacteroides sp. TaxID=512312 RepID=UPI0026F2CE40|nr:acylneuraminate cytidylyltransferase family protein [uncultured Parabacteroides sp.]